MRYGNQQPVPLPAASGEPALVLTHADTAAVNALHHSGFAGEERRSADLALTVLARVVADRDWLDALRRDGFAGPRFEMLKTGLAGYGLPVIRALIRTRRIFPLTYQRGRPVTCPETVRLHLDGHPDDRQELALDVIAEALRLFRDHALIGRRWDPSRGASLTTYFVGAGISVFPNVFRRWLKEFAVDRDQVTPVEQVPEVHARDDPAVIVCAYDSLRAVLATTADSPVLRATVAALIEGASYEEIAQRYGVSPAALKQQVYRWRRRLESRGQEWR